jgi:uncharacterized oxidoreductase
MLAILFEPGRLLDRGQMAREADALLAYVRSSRPIDGAQPVLVAGEPELRAREARLTQGVAIDAATWAQVAASAEAVGVDAGALVGRAQEDAT